MGSIKWVRCKIFCDFTGCCWCSSSSVWPSRSGVGFLQLHWFFFFFFFLLCGTFMTCSSSTQWYHVVRWIQSMFTIELQQTKKKHVKQKNVPFFWAFLMHIISKEIFLDLGQFFLIELGIKQKTMVLKYCTSVILFWPKRMTTSCSQKLVCFSNEHDILILRMGGCQGAS